MDITLHCANMEMIHDSEGEIVGMKMICNVASRRQKH